MTRSETGELIGYQRDEVRRHVDEIVEYLDSEDPLFPNAVILALGSRCEIPGEPGPNVSDGIATAGTLEISIPSEGNPRRLG